MGTGKFVLLLAGFVDCCKFVLPVGIVDPDESLVGVLTVVLVPGMWVVWGDSYTLVSVVVIVEEGVDREGSSGGTALVRLSNSLEFPNQN